MWCILIMATLKMSFSFANFLKQQLLYVVYLTKSTRSLGESLCLHRWCSNCARMLICISTFGTEWVTKNHQNSLYDSSANISNEDNAMRVTRSHGKHEFCQFCKGEHFQQPAVLSTVLPREQSSAISPWREMTVKRKSFKTCFWVSWWTQKIFKWES